MKKWSIAAYLSALLAVCLALEMLFVFNPLTGEYDFSAKTGFFHDRLVSVPQYLAEGELKSEILGENAADKRIEIDLTNQRLYAYEGDRMVYNFLVSTGKWGRTPTGTFQIWTKLRYCKMSGGSRALHTYYYLPNVPYVMYFYNAEAPQYKGFSLHGTYWHSNFGHPMSHGCVNMKTEEAALIYQWAKPDLRGKASIYASADNPGTTIVIYGKTPKG